jgi:TonB family protein
VFELCLNPWSVGRPLRISVLAHALAVGFLVMVRVPVREVAKPPPPRWTALVAPPTVIRAPPRLRRPRAVASSRQAFAWPSQNMAIPAEVAAPPVLAPSRPPPTGVSAPSMVEPPPRVEAILEAIPHPRLRVAVGGFTIAASGADAGPRRVVALEATGFDGTSGGARPSSEPRVIADAGFVSAGAVTPIRLRRRVEVPEPLSTGIEILDKPRPAYSEEARRLRIEGEVVLQALFAASGEVRVQRLIRGLGHGLDQNAIEAAEHIRFRPAIRGGRPADLVATIQITFQLAY